MIKDLIDLSEPEINEKTIFVWPEEILPGISQELIEYKWLFENRFSENHLLVVGTNSQVSKDGNINYFNSLSIYDQNLHLINAYNK